MSDDGWSPPDDACMSLGNNHDRLNIFIDKRKRWTNSSTANVYLHYNEAQISTGEEMQFYITVEGNVISCKKHQLMKQSEYFRGMLESSMVESQTNKVTLHGLKFDIVSSLIDFISTGELQIIPETIDALTETAVMLMIDEAISSCVAYYLSNLDDSNCLSIMSLSVKLNIHSLYNQTRQHALYYFDRVMNEEEFVLLEVDEVKGYLSDPHLNCSSEIKILDAILIWYKHEVEDREQSVTALLDCFHGEDLLKCERHLMLDHELVKQFTQCRQFGHFIDEVEKQGVSKKFREVPYMILTIGGCNENAEFCTDIYRFDEEKKMLKPYLNINDVYPKTSTKMGFQATVVGKDLYLSGGQESMIRSSWILCVWKLDGFTLKWEKVSQLRSPRRHHGACGSDDSLFVMGGFGKFRDILNTAEQYHTLNDCWIDLPKMPFKWFTPSAVFCENKLFVYKTHLICLDMKNLQWTTMKQLHSLPNQNVYSICPIYYKHFIYEVPYLDEDIDWFYETAMPELQIMRTNVDTGEAETVPCSKEIKLGNRCAVFNGHFFTLGHSSDTLICGNLPDLCEIKEIGTGSKSGNHCYIVVMPHYPEYKSKT